MANVCCEIRSLDGCPFLGARGFVFGGEKVKKGIGWGWAVIDWRAEGVKMYVFVHLISCTSELLTSGRGPHNSAHL